MCKAKDHGHAPNDSPSERRLAVEKSSCSSLGAGRDIRAEVRRLDPEFGVEGTRQFPMISGGQPPILPNRALRRLALIDPAVAKSTRLRATASAVNSAVQVPDRQAHNSLLFMMLDRLLDARWALTAASLACLTRAAASSAARRTALSTLG